ncbi:MAG: zot [Rhodocyclaceae bacterium]|nr:zot [Rhodocyclaceae bacterium]
MIIVHEGMPRSGKSYAAVKDHLIPALKKGRRIYARIDGLNYAQLAELAGITEEECRGLLSELTEEQCAKLEQQEFQKDALIIIDEAQNYWPQGRAQLPVPVLKWIAEHGHHGFDVLLMCQLLKDVHRAWVNRSNRKLQFIKKDVVGKANEYKWIMYHGSPDSKGNVKFAEVQKGDHPYEEQYFGAYKSHSDGTENKENYEDDRVNIWKSPMFRKWLPLLGLLGLLGFGYVMYLFNGGITAEKKPQAAKAEAPKGMPAPAPASLSAPAPVVTPAPRAAPLPEPEPKERQDRNRLTEWEFPDVVTELSKGNRMRLAGVLRTASATKIILEWRDSSLRVVDQMTTDQLRVLGWYALVTDDDRMAILTRPGVRYVATAWPIDSPVAKATEVQTQQIRRESQDFIRPPAVKGDMTMAARYIPASYHEEEPALPETGPTWVSTLPTRNR